MTLLLLLLQHTADATAPVAVAPVALLPLVQQHLPLRLNCLNLPD